MAQVKEKKPSYSLISNMVYILKAQYKYSPLSILVFSISVFVTTGLSFLGIYLPKLIVNSVVNQVSVYTVIVRVGLVGVAMIFLNGASKWISTYGAMLLNKITIELTALKTYKVLNTDYENIESSECRNVLQRADETLWGTGEGSGVERMIKNIFELISNMVCFLLFGAVLSFVDPWITILLTLLPIINYFAIVKVQKFQYNSRNYTSALDRKLWYIANQCGAFDGAKDVRVYGMNQWFIDMYRALTKERLRWSRRIASKSFLSDIFNAAIILVRDGFAYILLILMVLHGEIILENFVFYFAAVGSFSGWVSGIIEKIIALNEASLSICDLRDFLCYPEQNYQGKGVRPVRGQTCSIQLENVCFRYAGEETDTLKHLNLFIRAGEKVAVVGLNGAGKTTLIKCICGLYTPTSGSIKINGYEKHAYNIYDYYSMFGVVFQDFYFLPVSIAEIVSGTTMDKTDINRVYEFLDLVGLSEKISQLSEGIYSKMNKQVNENGIDMSGGEKQKLLLARALYKNAPILILDEPTAALDPIAENHIYQQYSKLTRNKTSIYISHRLSSTRFCDRILYMENGKVIESGSHQELMDLGEKYFTLFSVQSRYYKEEAL